MKNCNQLTETMWRIMKVSLGNVLICNCGMFYMKLSQLIIMSVHLSGHVEVIISDSPDNIHIDGEGVFK